MPECPLPLIKDRGSLWSPPRIQMHSCLLLGCELGGPFLFVSLQGEIWEPGVSRGGRFGGAVGTLGQQEGESCFNNPSAFPLGSVKAAVPRGSCGGEVTGGEQGCARGQPAWGLGHEAKPPQGRGQSGGTVTILSVAHSLQIWFISYICCVMKTAKRDCVPAAGLCRLSFLLILFTVAFPAAVFHSGAPLLGLMGQSRVDSQTPIPLGTGNVDSSSRIWKRDVEKGQPSQDTL